ncbi:MAG: xanthine dehydrogenase family protein subunit M [Acidimicrobiia bacterium]|nr:xanthine dehydrogenase family protein subunit M [Acidimicrobiia bacterium]
MKPPPLEYVRPRDLDDALALLAQSEDNMALAGGQSLIPMLNMRLARPGVLIDLNGLGELSGIRWGNNRVEIGAMTRHYQLERDPRLADTLPALVDAVSQIGYQAIRHRGTLGGSLAHTDPSAELPTVLTALDADIELTSPQGSHTIPADDFFTGYYSTRRRPDELITSVKIWTEGHPVLGFSEFSRRPGDFGIALVAVAMRRINGVATARAVVGGLDTRPRRITPLEERLVAGDVTINPDEVAAHTSPSGDIHGSAKYRLRLACELLERTVHSIGVSV